MPGACPREPFHWLARQRIVPGAGLNGGFDAPLKMVYRSYDWVRKGRRLAKDVTGAGRNWSSPIRYSAASFNSSAYSVGNAETLILARSLIGLPTRSPVPHQLLNAFEHGRSTGQKSDPVSTRPSYNPPFILWLIMNLSLYLDRMVLRFNLAPYR